MSPRSLSVLFVCVALVAPVRATQAYSGSFDANAFGVVSHDSNLFRFNSRDQARFYLGQPEMADTATIIGLNLVSRVTSQQQQLLSEVKWMQTRYDEFDFLDNQTGNLRLQWSGKQSARVNTNVEYSYRNTLTDFSSSRLPVKDKQQTNRLNVASDYFLTRNWSLKADATITSADHTAKSLEGANREDRALQLSTLYRDPWGIDASAHTEILSGSFPNRTLGAQSVVDSGFQQTRVFGQVTLKPTAHMLLDMNAGWVSRANNHLTGRDFSGLAGGANFQWISGAQLASRLGYERTVSSVDNLIANYLTEQRLRIVNDWRVTPKLGVSMQIVSARRVYNGLYAAFSERHDAMRRIGFDVNYAPRKYLSANIGWYYEDLASNDSIFDYRANNIAVQMQFTY